MQSNLVACAFLGGGFKWLCEAAALPTKTAMQLAVSLAGYEPHTATHPPPVCLVTPMQGIMKRDNDSSTRCLFGSHAMPISACVCVWTPKSVCRGSITSYNSH